MFRSSSSPGVNVFFISSNSFFPAFPPNNFRASSRSFVVILLKSKTLNCGTWEIQRYGHHVEDLIITYIMNDIESIIFLCCNW